MDSPFSSILDRCVHFAKDLYFEDIKLVDNVFKTQVSHANINTGLMTVLYSLILVFIIGGVIF